MYFVINTCISSLLQPHWMLIVNFTVSTVRWESSKDTDLEMEGATPQVKSTPLQRVLCQMAWTFLLALQLDIWITGMNRHSPKSFYQSILAYNYINLFFACFLPMNWGYWSPSDLPPWSSRKSVRVTMLL